MAKFISVPSNSEEDGYMEVVVPDTRLDVVTVRFRVSDTFVSQTFDRAEFAEWVQIVGTTLKNP